jgi:hypothetical protein
MYIRIMRVFCASLLGGMHGCVNQSKTINAFMYLCLNNGCSVDTADILVNYELFCTTRKEMVLDTSHFSSGEMIN